MHTALCHSEELFRFHYEFDYTVEAYIDPFSCAVETIFVFFWPVTNTTHFHFVLLEREYFYSLQLNVTFCLCRFYFRQIPLQLAFLVASCMLLSICPCLI